jgi:hypothetical protein
VHLADVLRGQGELIPFEDPELAGVFAAATQIARDALAGLPPEMLEADPIAVGIDMYALVGPDAEWQIAHFALDCFGTQLCDAPPISGMVLSAPTQLNSRILLRLQVGVPASGLDELLPRLRVAFETLVREFVGLDAEATFAVEPAEESGVSSG